eukprot:scaffold660697_cov41-Prasinocladus_malaysianus.AAC.1
MDAGEPKTGTGGVDATRLTIRAAEENVPVFARVVDVPSASMSRSPPAMLRLRDRCTSGAGPALAGRGVSAIQGDWAGRRADRGVESRAGGVPCDIAAAPPGLCGLV